MSAIAIIPARYASIRFPGKPLARETGKYLIQHVFERACAAQRISECLIATDDQRIFDAVQSFGGTAVMTRADHPSGTDRIAEAIQSRPGGPNDIVLNVQGDEPEIDPNDLDRLIERLENDPGCPMATLACPFPADADAHDPSAVKVVCDSAGRALYFSRSLIPYPRRAAGEGPVFRPLLHLGVYAYRRAFLLEYAAWPPSPLEQIEKLEQLRVLERGVALAVEVVERSFVGIDTPEDYAAFVQRCRAHEARATS